METIYNYNGCWKFSTNIPVDTIRALAGNLAVNERYHNIYVRKIGAQQYALGFEYVPKVPADKPAFDRFMTDTQDFINRFVGSGLVGWDISSEYNPIR